VLAEGLRSDDCRVRLQAAIHLAALGRKAEGALAEIKRTLADKSKGNYPLYTRWALGHAMDELER